MGLANKFPNLKVLPVIFTVTSAYLMRWRDIDPGITEHHIWIGAYRTHEDKAKWNLWKEFEDTAIY